MADFTESMKAFTDRLKSSIDERGESLASVHQATTDLLDGARDFLANVAFEHDLRSEQVQAFMSNSRAHRCETVKAMRDNHRENLAAMSDEMHRTLDEATRSRVEGVNAFMSASHAHRCETSKAMRDSHREELAAMSEELHHTLDEANKSRLETVGMMRNSFKTAQHELATDLRDAAKAWREFANRRHVAPAAQSTPVVHADVALATESSPAVHDEDERPTKAARRNAKRKASHSRSVR